MATQTKTATTGPVIKGRDLPKEAFDYNADVTKESVDRMKEKAAPIIDNDEWEVIDGFALHG